MSKRKDIEQIFKEGFEDYKAKPNTRLDTKMAAMIGISSASGASGAGSSAAGSTAIGASGTGLGSVSSVVGTSGKIGLLSKGFSIIGGVAKIVVIKIGLLAKSLGIVKTIVAIAVIGGGATLVIDEITENTEANDLRNDQTCHQTTMINDSNRVLSQNMIKLVADHQLLTESDDLFEENSLLIQKNGESEDQFLPSEDIDRDEANLLIASSDKYAINAVNKKAVVEIEKAADAHNQVDFLQEIQAKRMELFLIPSSRIPEKSGAKLMAPVPQPLGMNTLEKGFYLPNYDITANISVMPMMSRQVFQNGFQNDSITSHEFKYSSQLSWQIGAALRIQKKRSPWFMQLGLNYMNIQQKSESNYNQEYIDYGQSYWNTDTIHYDIYINPPNIDTILEIDSNFMAYWIRNKHDYTSVNSFQLLEIPLKIGYQYHSFTKKWSLEAGAGLSVALILNSKGNTYNSSGEMIDFSGAQLQPKIQFFTMGHVAFNYHFNRFTVFLMPTVKYQISRIGYQYSSENNQFFLFGTQIGVRFKLFQNAGQP